MSKMGKGRAVEKQRLNQVHVRNKGVKVPAARTKSSHVLYVKRHSKTVDHAKNGFIVMTARNRHTEIVQKVTPI